MDYIMEKNHQTLTNDVELKEYLIAEQKHELELVYYRTEYVVLIIKSNILNLWWKQNSIKGIVNT